MHGTLFQNFVKTLRVFYQNKTKIPSENRKCLVLLQEVTSCINYTQDLSIKFGSIYQNESV